MVTTRSLQRPHAETRPLALVTGASGGIGECIAAELAGRGHDLVLVARSENRLTGLAERLRVERLIDTTVIPLDLTAREAATRLHEALTERNLSPDVLVNNAGFAACGRFEELSLDMQLDMIQLNVTTLTALTHLLLPGMLDRSSGRILNVASTAAFMPGPLMATYYATKAYVLSLSEALNEEVRGRGVTVTALCPGPTTTNFQDRANLSGSRLLRGRPMMTAQAVARAGVDAMLRGQPVVVPGVLDQLQALTPRFLPHAVLARVVRSAQAPK